jgi:dihydroorotase
MNKIAQIIQPDDFHVHLRDGEYLKHTVQYSSKYGRAVIMPNLKPPITSIKQAWEYKNRILEINPSFGPLMTLYLNPSVKKEELKEIPSLDWLLGIKLYPSGATTHSEEGVKISELEKFYAYFELMEKYQIPLMVHGEVSDYEIDFFEREKIFIEKYLINIREKFPKLKIILEHVSSKVGVDFVNSYDNTAATVTPQHLHLTRNDLFFGGIQPHHFCLPIVKTAKDQEAIAQEVLKGNPKFFAGTDSAPHPKNKKESCCGPAGVFSAPISIELYLYFFEKHNKMDWSLIEKFLSKYGADFYGLEYNKRNLSIFQEPLYIPQEYPLGKETVVPMWAGKTLNYTTLILD